MLLKSKTLKLIKMACSWLIILEWAYISKADAVPDCRFGFCTGSTRSSERNINRTGQQLMAMGNLIKTQRVPGRSSARIQSLDFHVCAHVAGSV